MNDYRLIFTSPEGKEFKAKAITNCDYVLIDPDTGEKIRVARWTLTKTMGFKAAKSNSRLKSPAFLKARRIAR